MSREHDVEIVARRTTVDSFPVVLWSDGAVTGVFGHALPGVPVTRPRTAESRDSALRAGWLFMGEVELYEKTELPALYAACRQVAKRGGDPGDVRALLARDARPTLRPMWAVTSADRDGRATERVWRLPRLMWPGLVVWDHVSHGRSGRYEVTTVDQKGVCMTTGMFFPTLDTLSAYLWSVARA